MLMGQCVVVFRLLFQLEISPPPPPPPPPPLGKLGHFFPRKANCNSCITHSISHVGKILTEVCQGSAFSLTAMGSVMGDPE